MPCDDCSRTESCPPCPHEEEPKGSEPSSTDLRCKCGHPRTSHSYGGSGCIGNRNLCGCFSFTCDHTRCGWKPREDCQHPDNDPCDRCLMPRSYYIQCGCGHVQGEHRTFIMGGCRNCRCKTFALPPEEPPMTPEEEEEAPCPHESWDVTGEHRDLLTRKWVKSRRCNDCGEDLDNVLEGEPHWVLTPAEPPPPQPGRRPPYAVAYSVQGHLYEVALPGDANVFAVDGALIIKHNLGPVAGICSVLPVINEEKA
jgi:hypothetical protein